MSSRKLPDHRGYKSRADGDAGPTYADARELAADLEREFTCRIEFILDPEDVMRRWAYSRMWLRCRAYHFLENDGRDAYASSPIGGISGAKTMPGAMVAALLAMWDLLSDMRLQHEPIEPEGSAPTPIERAILEASQHADSA